MPHKLIKTGRRQWRKRFGVLPMRHALAGLNEWFSSPLGQLLVAREQDCLDNEVRDLFGYHLLQLSVVGDLDLTPASRISHRFALYPQISEHPIVSGLADFTHLPLPPNSIDLVLLHHVLDYSQKPHQVLREAASTLISRGHIIVIGFNPWSLLGMWRWLVRLFSDAAQWRHQALRLGRVLDWLTLLDFEPVVVRQGFYCPPTHKPSVTKYLQWMERWGKRLCLPWGGFYVIVARKDSVAMTPIKPQWQRNVGLRGWGVTKILGKATRGKEQLQRSYKLKK